MKLCELCHRLAQYDGYCITHSKEAQEKNSKATHKYNLKMRNAVLDAYGGKCNCCGESERLFLQLDHLNNNGNTHRLIIGGVRNASQAVYRHLVRSNFPPGYQILCANCNIGKHLNKGTCPHKV